MRPFEDIKLGLECCLIGECWCCPFYPIPDRRQCRASLHDNAIEYFQQLDEIRKERDDLADRVYELEEALEEYEEVDDEQ